VIYSCAAGVMRLCVANWMTDVRDENGMMSWLKLCAPDSDCKVAGNLPLYLQASLGVWASRAMLEGCLAASRQCDGR
jgi:hypothetical protein